MNNNDQFNPQPAKIAVEPTRDGVQRCRFDMFLRLYANIPSEFPKNSRIWNYRGDKFTDIEGQMLANLVRHIIRKRNLYALIELYDNSYPKNHPDRIVVKMDKQEVLVNHLYRYADMLKNLSIPTYLT